MTTSFDFCFVLLVRGVDFSSVDFLDALILRALCLQEDSVVLSRAFSNASEVERVSLIALFFT